MLPIKWEVIKVFTDPEGIRYLGVEVPRYLRLGENRDF